MNFLKSFIKRGNKIIPNALNNIKIPNITKVDYKIENSNEPNNLLRTLIDDDMKYEDIFSDIIQQGRSKIPDQNESDKGKLTLFVPLDEVLVYSYTPDENMGLFDMPKLKEYDLRIELPEYKSFCFIYFRDHLEEFLNFIDERFEPILYTTGEKLYVDRIMNTLDPNKIFRHRLYQEDCHLFKNSKQNMAEYLKDINLLTNRSLKRKVLIEYSTLNFVISPDNSNL